MYSPSNPRINFGLVHSVQVRIMIVVSCNAHKALISFSYLSKHAKLKTKYISVMILFTFNEKCISVFQFSFDYELFFSGSFLFCLLGIKER